MLTFVVRRIAYSIPVLLLASLLVFVFVHATTDPLAQYRQSRDLTLIAREGLEHGIYEQPCRTFTAGAPAGRGRDLQEGTGPQAVLVLAEPFRAGQDGPELRQQPRGEQGLKVRPSATPSS